MPLMTFYSSSGLKIFEMVLIISSLTLLHCLQYESISYTILINGVLCGYLILVIGLLIELSTNIYFERYFYMSVCIIGAALFSYCGVINIAELYQKNEKNPWHIYSFGIMFLFVGVMFIVDYLNLYIVRYKYKRPYY